MNVVKKLINFIFEYLNYYLFEDFFNFIIIFLKKKYKKQNKKFFYLKNFTRK